MNIQSLRQFVTSAAALEGMIVPMITSIVSARITTYSDSGQTIAYVSWRDSRGQTGTTSGDPNNLHMQALLARAKREGLTVLVQS